MTWNHHYTLIILLHLISQIGKTKQKFWTHFSNKVYHCWQIKISNKYVSYDTMGGTLMCHNNNNVKANIMHHYACFEDQIMIWIRLYMNYYINSGKYSQDVTFNNSYPISTTCAWLGTQAWLSLEMQQIKDSILTACQAWVFWHLIREHRNRYNLFPVLCWFGQCYDTQ